MHRVAHLEACCGQETNLNVCQESLKNTESSLDLIKDFLTTTEVQ